MDKDVQRSSNPEVKREQENQNRRQFFNSLGKWSLAVVAAIAAFPGDFQLTDGESGFGSPPGTRFEGKDASQQIVRKPKPYLVSWDQKYYKSYQDPPPQKPGKSKTPGGTPPGLEEPLEKKGK